MQKNLLDSFLETNFSISCIYIVFTWSLLCLICSDKISLDRSIPDVRSSECKAIPYGIDLPSASVVIIFTDEAWTPLMRTVHSVINRSPPLLLEEVILLDDNSQRGYFLFSFFFFGFTILFFVLYYFHFCFGCFIFCLFVWFSFYLQWAIWSRLA